MDPLLALKPKEDGPESVPRARINFTTGHPSNHELCPNNACQILMAGALNTLASSSSWCQLVLEDDEVLLWSGDDQRGTFYAWELPRRGDLSWPSAGQFQGITNSWEYVASRVIPMGWIQAVSLFQHLRRHLGMAKEPEAAGHHEALECRRDKPIPQTADGFFTEFVQFYLDDFDSPELVPSVGWEGMQGTLSATHERQRQAIAGGG